MGNNVSIISSIQIQNSAFKHFSMAVKINRRVIAIDRKNAPTVEHG
jgi:hypothetical protein